MVAVTDSSGNVVEQYHYTAYGKPAILDGQGQEIAASAIGNAYMFTGRRLDTETGLYHYRNRYYSADLGRFVSRDPIGYWGGINLYAYVTSNPLFWMDPYGLQEDLTDAMGDEYFLTRRERADLEGRCRPPEIYPEMMPGDSTTRNLFTGIAEVLFVYPLRAVRAIVKWWFLDPIQEQRQVIQTEILLPSKTEVPVTIIPPSDEPDDNADSQCDGK